MREDDIQNFRRQRLQALIDLKFGGNRSATGRALGYKDGAFVRQMLAGSRPITEKTVAQIEELPGCHAWFNAPIPQKGEAAASRAGPRSPPSEPAPPVAALLHRLAHPPFRGGSKYSSFCYCQSA